MTIKKLLLTTTAICGAACFAHNANAAIEVGTWADFKDAITSGTETDIILTGDIVVDTNTSLTINRDITISSKGDNKFTISVADGLEFSSPFLKNSAGKTLTLSNVEVKGVKNRLPNGTSYNGSAIHNQGTIENITGSTFTGNTANSRGAIYNDGGTISNIIGSTFTGNTAQYGSAIYNYNGTIGTLSATFENNKADGKFSGGSAIYNDNGTISSITSSTFTGNSATETGGAIYNKGTISSIASSTFTGNSANGRAGGAISNYGTISSIIGSTFTENSGSAIYNGGTISSIIGSTFTENSGGAIYNIRTIRTLSATFENNSASYGSAIYNYNGTIGTLSATFENNKADGKFSGGSAIYNDNGTISSITSSTFTGNSATGDGGAIYNKGTISSITSSTFTGNGGGAIYNYSGTIGTLSATFENNTAEVGGAIGNNEGGTINLVADAADSSDNLLDEVWFKGNVATSGQGAAIYNMGDLTFTANNNGAFTFYDDIYSNGGAMTFTGDGSGKFNLFNDIKGSGTLNFNAAYDFNMVNNTINTVEASTININKGSALSLDADLSGVGAIDRFVGAVNVADGEDALFTIKSLNFLNDFDTDVAGLKLAVASGNILKEDAEEKTLVTSGGTYKYSNDKQNVNVIKVSEEGGFSKFVSGMINLPDNRAYSFTEDEEMKLIYDNGENITGIVSGDAANLTINGNDKVLTAVEDNNHKFGKALSLASGQKAAVNNLTFKGFDEAISNSGELTLNNVNITDSKAGLVINKDNTINISGETTFSGNDNDILANVTGGGQQYQYPLSAALMNYQFSQDAADANMTFDEYMAALSTALSSQLGETVVMANGDDYIKLMIKYDGASEGLDENSSDYDVLDAMTGSNISENDYNLYLDTIKNASTDIERYAYGLLFFNNVPFADAQSEFDALTDEEKANLQAQIDAFYQTGMPELSTAFSGGYATQTMMMADNSVVNFNSKISGADAFGLNLSGAENSLVNLGENAVVENADLVLDGPILKIANEDTNLANVNSFEAKSGTIDMTNGAARRLVANNLKITGDIKLFVDVDLAQKVMDNLGDLDESTTTGKVIVDKMILLNDAEENTTNIAFTNTAKDKVDTTVKSAETLKYRYAVEYDKETGEFKFVKSDKNSSQQIAESVGAPSTSVGVQQTQSALNSLLANRNIYIGSGLASGDATRPTTWAKAFGSKDSVELKHSYNSIDTQFYGVVGGVDSRTFIYDNGINAVYGIYAAYMGSNQKQNSVKVTQDGGYLGVSADFTRNGVFSRFTAHGGYIANEAKTAWGNDKFDIWTASVSNKTGYEIDFGEYTLKPALYASYMYINTENYTSKAGAKLKNHTKNVFEVTPEVKLAKDFGTGLEGYAKVAYTWNFYQGGKVTADDVLLPKMSVKPYVEYGVGLEKDWSEEEWNAKDITSYAEINRHDGGRTGWDINAGLKFQF